MFVSNHPQNLIRIPPGEQNSSALNTFSQKLIAGQVLRGKILDLLSGGKALVDLEGQKLTLQTAGGLTRGQNIFVRVEQVSPTLNLRIIDPPQGRSPAAQPDINVQLTPARQGAPRSLTAILSDLKLEPNQVIEGKISRIIEPKTLEIAFKGKQLPVKIAGGEPGFRPGQSISAVVRREAGGLTLIAQNPNTVRVDAAMIKPYLVAKQDLGQMAANLEKVLLNQPLPQGLKIDPGLLGRLRETLSVLLPREGKTPDDSRLKEQVDRSGIHYEAKVKKALAKELTSESRSALARDLKGQLLELQGALEKQALRESERTSLAAGRGQSIREFAHQIKLSADNIEFQQLSNQFARQDNNPILIQIPDPFSPETRTAKLYVREDQTGEGAKKGEKTNFHLVFLLNLSGLGNLRIDAKMNRSDVAAKITAEEKAVADYIAGQLPRLESRLKEMGFDAAITAAVEETIAMDAGENLTRMLIDEPARLVDIKT